MPSGQLHYCVVMLKVGYEIENDVEMVEVVVFVGGTPSENDAIVLVIFELPLVLALWQPVGLDIDGVGYELVLRPVEESHSDLPQNEVLALNLLFLRDGHSSGSPQLDFEQNFVLRSIAPVQDT